MTDFIIKFNLLNPVRQQEVLDFLDFIFNKQQIEKSVDFKSYKASILKVSTWDETTINEMKQNQQQLNQWPIQEW